MNNLKKPSFLVDVSETMIKINVDENIKNVQKIFCNCGKSADVNAKLIRDLIKNHDDLFETSESKDSLNCPNCQKQYNKFNKLFLLTKDNREEYAINFFITKNKEIITLNKERMFAEYKDEKIEFSTMTDFISINLKTKKSFINIDSQNTKDGFDCEINSTNVFILEKFFSFKDFIDYKNIYQCFLFLEEMKPFIKDLDKFKNISFLSFLFKNNKIFTDINSEDEIYEYQEFESGFNDGKTIKKKLSYGDYMFNLLKCYKLFIAIFSHDNLSNIIVTKSYDFFNKFIESSFICPPDVYIDRLASSPVEILETSMRFDKHNKLREVFNNLSENVENNGFLKISGTIYNSINKVNNLKVLNDIYTNSILNKSEIEYFLQKYDTNRIYNLLDKVSNKNSGNDIFITPKNIKHILNNEFDLEEGFLTTYIDTIRVIGLLELKDNLIFKIKTYNDLKVLHDDYSSRYSAMRDSKKAEMFIEAVKPFTKYNMQIDDVEFEIVSTTEKLNLEGLQLNHCIYTYLNRICDKDYLAINLTHTITKERATAGFLRNGDKLEFEQLKGFYNSRATSELIESVKKYCKKNKFKISEHTYDLGVDVSKQRMMPGQMSEKELFELRKETENKKD